jgi:hypothetical protein
VPDTDLILNFGYITDDKYIEGKNRMSQKMEAIDSFIKEN